MSQQRFSITVIAIILGCLTAESGVLAQDNQQASSIDDDTIEEIIVTGTRIKRRDFNTVSPLTTINTEDIAFTGQSTIEETLNQMPQVMPGFGRTTNFQGDGTSAVDLRGLGPGRSLVLLNGRRVAPTGIGNAVDLNNIPQSLIERVEIITGGASAVYGSDAVAGVVNLITKDEYSGFGVEAGMSMAEPGDAETYDFSLAYGHNFAGGRGNITAYTNILERKHLYAADREFTRIQYWDDWDGNLVADGSSRIPGGRIFYPPVDFGNGPATVTFNPDGTPREFVSPDDWYNYLDGNYLQLPLSRLALGVMGHYELSQRFEAYLEAGFISNSAVISREPVFLNSYAEINLDNPVLTPEAQQLFADNYTCAPNLACVYLSRRLSEVGVRRDEYDREYSRIVAGFRGELWKDWEFDGWITYTTESSAEAMHNFASKSRLLQGLQVDPVNNECFDPSGGCVPLNIFGEGNLSAEGVAFIGLTNFENVTERTNKLASVFVSGSPIDTWAGSLDMAVGVEWRSDSIYFEVADGFSTGDVLGSASDSSASGTEEVLEVYAEAVVPLASDRAWARYLGLEVGGRYSENKNAGGVWTYKAGGEWQPLDSLRFRAMKQRSVRAPNNYELFQKKRFIPKKLGPNTSRDWCSASRDPVGNGFREKCILQGLPADQVGIWEATANYPFVLILGGNPNLVPEVAETWTVGAVISPSLLPNWTFTIDYFALEVADTIGAIDAGLICFDPKNTSHVFCENFRRDGTGNVDQVTQLTSNRGLLETTGIDTQIQYSADLPGFFNVGDHSADITLNLYWTYMLTNKEQENPVTEVIDCAGYFGWPCPANTYPGNRVTGNIHYASGSLGLHLTWRWIDGTDNAAPFRSEEIYGVPDPDLAVPNVSDKHYFDLGLSYTFNDHLTARFGVNNLLDNDPPQMADTVSGINTDTALYDAFGRSYYLNLSAQF